MNLDWKPIVVIKTTHDGHTWFKQYEVQADALVALPDFYVPIEDRWFYMGFDSVAFASNKAEGAADELFAVQVGLVGISRICDLPLKELTLLAQAVLKEYLITLEAITVRKPEK
jgi:hypothetical protein